MRVATEYIFENISENMWRTGDDVRDARDVVVEVEERKQTDFERRRVLVKEEHEGTL